MIRRKKVIPYEENTKVVRKLPEIVTFDNLIAELESIEVPGVSVKTETLCRVRGLGLEFPIKSVTVGSLDPESPCLFLVGGIHGLERIGSQVVLTGLDALIDRLRWDHTTEEMLRAIRIVFVPIMNPIGIYRGRRSNGNGVDLMRNSPIEAEGDAVFFMGGQRYSRHLPYFRGEDLEAELVALISLLERSTAKSALTVAVDFHSGFGTVDQLWFPYAKTKEPFANLAEIHALKNHFDESYPAHGYLVEPQALNYTTHGDLWDYIYDLKGPHDSCHFLPLTLEMGSWYWILKNPIQVLSRHGYFNPLNHKHHDEVLRSHLVLFDFLLKAVNSYDGWARLGPTERDMHLKYAKELWYGK